MRDQQQIQNLNEGNINITKQQITKQQRWKYSLVALFYKNKALYKQNYCSNICQLITPLLCILFTIIVRYISQNATTGMVGDFAFLQPMHLPQINHLIPAKGIKCSQRYYYSFSKKDQPTKQQKQMAKQLYQHVLKAQCSQTHKLSPQFISCDDTNQQAIEDLNEANLKTFKRGVDIYDKLPDGLIKINQISKNKLNITLSINDWRIPQYHINNGVTKLDLHSENSLLVTYLRVTEGMMSLIQKITRSYLQMNNSSQIISGSFMYMPFNGEDKSFINKASNVIGSSLYPLALSLLFPIILFNIVSQKQEKLIQIMKMNGLLMKYYWINFLFSNAILSMLSCGILFFLGKFAFDIIFFQDTDWFVIWILFVGWSIAQVSLATFIQIFINNSKASSIIGYLLSIFSVMIGQTICQVIYPYPDKLPVYLLLFPPFALTRGIYLIGFACANNSACFKNITNISNQMYTVYLCLYSWIFMFLLSIYLHSIIQQQFGTAKKPKWLKFILQLNKTQQKIDFYSVSNFQDNSLQLEINQQTDILVKDNNEVDSNKIVEQCSMNQDDNNNKIDISVLNQVNKTNNMKINQRPLVIKKLGKFYQNGHKALLPNSFSLKQKQIFGLLGPNGAGKTTLISVLTGLYGASQGSAWIDGVQIGQQQSNLKIGVCPQFDLLWETLTISQHLRFYGILKGIDNSILSNSINKLLKDVDLLQQRDVKCSKLSGGMRRRLSLAIALTGNPKVVFLDEPSSGLDPSHRRQMWDILLKCKSSTTILLTTHLMEQAEALCDRIGIIDKGLLRCIGTKNELKQRFGMGYRITVHLKEWKGQRQKVLEALRESQCETVSDLQSRIMVKVSKQKMLQCVKKLSKFASLNWLLSQPSLYDVFMHFVH